MNFFRNIYVVFGRAMVPCLQWEKLKQPTDNSRIVAAQVADFSKALVCMLHELLIAKWNAYMNGLKALKLMKIMTPSGIKEERFNESYSSLEQTLFEVLQGSVLGLFCATYFLVIIFLFWMIPTLLNMLLITPCIKRVDVVVETLRISTKNLFKWSKCNKEKATQSSRIWC